jgi:branched-chain amino acid transport system ATP-binding protein
MTMLEVRNVTKRFGSLTAVKDVSMAVKSGELRAIIGPNGAGKTTFFNMISGYFPPTQGAILFEGRDVTRIPAHARVGLGMGRTFQITEVFPELSGSGCETDVEDDSEPRGGKTCGRRRR